MLFEWTEKKIELYVRASRQTGFHKRLAEYVIPYLKKEDEISDIGCGPGLIDIELSRYVKSIRAVDIEPLVIDYLSKSIIEANIDNVFPHLADAEKLETNIGDVVLFCYFNSVSENMCRLIDDAKRLAIIIMHGDNTAKKPSKISANIRKPYATEMENMLTERGYSFTKTALALDFSQPLKTTAEAVEFLNMYCTETDPMLRKTKLDEGILNLRERNDSEYSFIVPSTKDVAIFIVTK